MFGWGRWGVAGLAALALLMGAMRGVSQDELGLHAKITGRVYQDRKIIVRAPAGWSLAIDTDDNSGRPLNKGAILRKGKFVLRLCTGCGQASGIAGGRFNEISLLVQPWYRIDPLANPSPCGTAESSQAAERLDRIDFWYRRDGAHPSSDDQDDCREPKTTATVWYGSYFTEHCSLAGPEQECGGYFLHDFAAAKTPDSEDEDIVGHEMAFGMTYDTDDLDRLPHKDDPKLARVLRQASAIVKSIQFRRH